MKSFTYDLHLASKKGFLEWRTPGPLSGGRWPRAKEPDVNPSGLSPICGAIFGAILLEVNVSQTTLTP